MVRMDAHVVWYDVVWHGVDGWPPATHHPSHHQLCSMHPPPQPRRRGLTFKASKCICDKRTNHHQSPWTFFKRMPIKSHAISAVGGSRGVTFEATEIAYIVGIYQGGFFGLHDVTFFQLWWLIMSTFCIATLVSIGCPGQPCHQPLNIGYFEVLHHIAL